jgi:hypothetical protein
LNGPLRNQRHEAFARALFENKSATEAYAEAGYKPDRKNAARLTTKDDIRARLSELQAAAQKASEVTVASLMGELEDARQKASTKDQLSAAVAAISLKAKLSGLLTMKLEVTNRVEEIDRDQSPDQIAAQIARGIAQDQGITLTKDELEGLKKVIVQCLASISEYLSGCTAKQIEPIVDMAELHNIERRRLGLTVPAAGNGSQR